jgi:hypothetical protein
MEQTCMNCDRPNSALLRVVLIGEIVRADEATLYALAEIFQTLGLLDASDEAEATMLEMSGMCYESPANTRSMLRLVK